MHDKYHHYPSFMVTTCAGVSLYMQVSGNIQDAYLSVRMIQY